MYVLGINAVYHDSAACLVADGHVLAAAEEERFNRIKHGKRPIPFSAYELPFHAIDYCLREAGISLSDVDHIAYSYRPTLLLGRHSGRPAITLPLEPSAVPVDDNWESPWDPLFLSSVVNAPRHLAGGVPHHLKARLTVGSKDGTARWHFLEHHHAHAASAFLASPFASAAVLTLDGRGEKATTSYWRGNGSHLRPLGQVEMPHSLGLLYERVTEHLGFLHSSDEYKVMALASFGRPAFLEALREAVRVQVDGRYTISPLDLETLAGPPRVKGGALEQWHYDLARSLQMILEETVLTLAAWLHAATGEDNLCLAGGVALNCVMNARLRDEGPFQDVWVQPAAGDAGTALGGALLVDAEVREGAPNPAEQVMDGAVPVRPGVMHHAFLGPSYGDDEIEGFLRWSKLAYRRLDSVAEQAADLLARGLIVGWFQGRMEFGPRALGARSILASPLEESMRDRLNDIKDREDFRPVAPVVLEEKAGEWFRGARSSPFMLFVFDVLPEKETLIPAVRHVDGTARIQTVNRRQHPLYYDLLRAFQARTGVPLLVNTSFNTRGEPIVCTPRDAVECFWTSPLDALVIGSFLLEKPEGAR